MKLEDRWQFQPWHVKAFRWLRWRPWYMGVFFFRLAKWILQGAEPCELFDGEHRFTTHQTARLIFDCANGEYHFAVGQWKTMEEIRDEIKAKG